MMNDMLKIRNKNRQILKPAVLAAVVLSFLGFSTGANSATNTSVATSGTGPGIFDCSKYLQNSVVTTSDCDLKTGNEKTQCEAFDKKAKAYCDLVEIKSKTQLTLKNQLSLIDTQQATTKVELQKTQEQSNTIEQKIASLDEEISNKETLIAYQEKVLSGLIQSYYEYNQDGVLQIILLKDNFSDFFGQGDRTEQIGSKVGDVLSNVQDTKNQLQNEYDQITSAKEESDNLKKELQTKTDNLQYSEQQKVVLLTQTQGEEQKYRDLLARVEQQKMELFDFSSASNSDELIASVASYSKPDSKYWASSWYFSQRDPRWANQSIGNTKTLMSGYGCAVTSLAMVFRENGASVDPSTMAKQPIFSGDLIQWPGSCRPSITLASGISHSGVNWSTVNSEISKGNTVIVYIKKTNGKGGHYVVVHHYDPVKKDYVVNDPYFGANLYLSTSKALVGKIGIDSGVALDQMIIYKK